MGNTTKKNDKLPRGDFYYVQAGVRFYAGDHLISREIEEAVVTSPKQARFSDWNWHWGRTAQTSRSQRDKRKGSLAGYISPRKPSTKVTRKILTGSSQPILADDISKAKKFRKKNQAQSACERLKSVYSELDTDITVKLFKGEKK